jgi:hypothetical protein
VRPRRRTVNVEALPDPFDPFAEGLSLIDEELSIRHGVGRPRGMTVQELVDLWLLCHGPEGARARVTLYDWAGADN